MVGSALYKILCNSEIKYKNQKPDMLLTAFYYTPRNEVVGGYRGFKAFYNRRYFLNFRRYLKNLG